jgi:hypothetical protein
MVRGCSRRCQEFGPPRKDPFAGGGGRDGPDQRPDGGANVFWQRRPRGHEGGQVGIGNAPFASLALGPGTPGGTPGISVCRNCLVRNGFTSWFRRTVDPVVAGSSPVALANANRCNLVRKRARLLCFKGLRIRKSGRLNRLIVARCCRLMRPGCSKSLHPNCRCQCLSGRRAEGGEPRSVRRRCRYGGVRFGCRYQRRQFLDCALQVVQPAVRITVSSRCCLIDRWECTRVHLDSPVVPNGSWLTLSAFGNIVCNF